MFRNEDKLYFVIEKDGEPVHSPKILNETNVYKAINGEFSWRGYRNSLRFYYNRHGRLLDPHLPRSFQEKKFATNENDTTPVIGGFDYVIVDGEVKRKFDYSVRYEKLRYVIKVWLGNPVHREYERTISYKDLLIVAKRNYQEDEKEISNWRQFHWRKFRGKKYSVAKHSYAKNYGKISQKIDDYEDEYKDFFKGKDRLKIQAKNRNSWDFYDNGRKKGNSNGWKGNTKYKKQYMKGVKG